METRALRVVELNRAPESDPEASPTFSFVVPCYNEAVSLAGTVAEIEIAAQAAGIGRYEIVVVNDASTDDTGIVLARLATEKPYVRPVTNERNLGLGGAYKAGVRHAHGTYVMMIPGDNAHPADGIVPILKQAGKADIVIPSVANPEARSWPRRLASVGFTQIINRLFGVRVPYFNGLVLHKTELLRQITIVTDSYAYQAEAVVKLLKNGATFASLPVRISEREQGGSKAFRPKNIYRVLKTIVDLKRHIG